ncbi:Crp/Fnr family transcriptional regulator [Rhizobium sp. SSA_523]|uniref:Crp/Fnr family transcriptional regulator n=1 Tax=Rhizobium sp. SSA_523 TaxID=2952477 RepID=UPI0020912621|nr:Crp/Fnr family transcriptional regulator [Rhizobium sp. SSA_523]MCO5732107.1 Crp/Fnr family transcriptional regulator [Rhizobium sp. SSA_523]WKC25691.1 Crp/Fnr family transcriptional regulator [Rhizobium sp. SSA_523]
MRAVSAAAMSRLLDMAHITAVPARGMVFSEGEPAQAFYCVLSGYVRLYRVSRDGRQADIRVSGPGDLFAECLIYGGDTYRFSAQAAEISHVARFDIAEMRALADQDQSVSRAIMATLSDHLLSTMDCVVNDRLHTAPQRVADYLLARCGVESGQVSVRLPFQKSLLAGMLGLAPEALSRAFSSLRRTGVTVRGRVIQIGDVDALRQV